MLAARRKNNPARRAKRDQNLGLPLLWSTGQSTTVQHHSRDHKKIMSNPSGNPFEILLDQIRQIVREEITAAMNNSGHPTGRIDDNGLLNVDMAAAYLSVSSSWLYKNSHRLPFAKKVGGSLRFDKGGMRRWLESQRR